MAPNDIPTSLGRVAGVEDRGIVTRSTLRVGPVALQGSSTPATHLPESGNHSEPCPNPITVTIRPARIVLEIDPRTPTKIARGKIIQLRFTAERKQGFIGKVHTELVAPGGVVGLRLAASRWSGSPIRERCK